MVKQFKSRIFKSTIITALLLTVGCSTSSLIYINKKSDRTVLKFSHGYKFNEALHLKMTYRRVVRGGKDMMSAQAKIYTFAEAPQVEEKLFISPNEEVFEMPISTGKVYEKLIRNKENPELSRKWRVREAIFFIPQEVRAEFTELEQMNIGLHLGASPVRSVLNSGQIDDIKRFMSKKPTDESEAQKPEEIDKDFFLDD